MSLPAFGPGVAAPDQAYGPFIGQVVPAPVDQHQQPVAEADQPYQVHGQPDYPGDEAAELDTVDVRHSRGAADRRHAAAVFVDEALRRPSLERAPDVLGDEH